MPATVFPPFSWSAGTQVSANRPSSGTAPTGPDVALYLGRCVHIGGDVIPLAPLGDLLRQVRRSSPGSLSEAPGSASLQQWLAPASTAPTAGGVFDAGSRVVVPPRR